MKQHCQQRLPRSGQAFAALSTSSRHCSRRLLLLLWLMGYGPGGAACKAPAAAAMAPAVTPPALSTATAPTSVAAAPAAAPAAVAPAVVAAAPAVASAAAPAQVATTRSDPLQRPARPPPCLRPRCTLRSTSSCCRPAPTRPLAEVVGFLKKTDGAKAHVTGFHDPSGSVAHNEELAHNRARAVRGALEAQGIARDRIMMDKPSVTTGSGEPREARRVEVRVE